MRIRIASSLLLLSGVALGWACSSSGGSSGPSPDDAGGDGFVTDDGGADADAGIPPAPDGSVARCTLIDKSDPVSLCLQKVALSTQVMDAYAKGQGVAPAWDSMTGIAASGHSWRDDVGFAASVGSYRCSAAFYGDTELTPTLDGVMTDLGPVIVGELPSAPAGYDGEDYFRLRTAAVGLEYAGDSADAAKVRQLAEAFARNLMTTYAHAVKWTAQGGGGGASDGGANEAGASDGGASDGGSSDAGAAPTVTSTLLGTSDGQGHVVYAPAQVIMGAAALLDLATLHTADADAGTEVASWVTAALSSIDYVWARGRDPKTGLFYPQLVTSGDPAHDALGQGAPTPDALLTDVQAAAVLAFARSQDALNALAPLVADDAGIPGFGPDASVLAQSKYWLEATQLVQSLVTVGLFDGTMTPPMNPPPGAFMEALIPSTGAIDTNKTTLGNAWLMGGLHRVAAGMTSHVSDVVVGQVTAALVLQQGANSSLFTVVVGATSGRPIQTDYLRAASKDYHYANVFLPDGGFGAAEPGAQSYRSDAVAAAIEGLTQLWVGRAGGPQCPH